MSDVRRHLHRPQGSGNHHLSFLRRCRTCKEDIISEEELASKHGYNGELCNNPRGEARSVKAALAQWHALCKRIYPSGIVSITGFDYAVDTHRVSVSDTERNIPIVSKRPQDVECSYIRPMSDLPSTGPLSPSRTVEIEMNRLSPPLHQDQLDHPGIQMIVDYLSRQQYNTPPSPSSIQARDYAGPPLVKRWSVQSSESDTWNFLTRKRPGAGPTYIPGVEEVSAYFLDMEELPASFEVTEERTASIADVAKAPSSALGHPNSDLGLSCSFCSRTFTGEYRRGNLARHVRTVHGGGDRVESMLFLQSGGLLENI
jgi:hypothetical protein